MRNHVKYQFITGAIIIFASCSLETNVSDQAVSNSVSIPESLANRFREAKYIEDIFDSDTLKLQIPEEFSLPSTRSIHFLQNGEILLGLKNEYILRFDPNGRMIQKIGESGQGPGEYTWPWFVHSNSRNEIVVGDAGQRKITLIDEKGAFVNSFHIRENLGGLFLSPENEIIVNDNYVAKIMDKETIYFYSRAGKLLRKFGGASEPGAKLKQVPFTPSYGPFLTIFGEYVFEADYPDYKIRKYNMHGESIKEFGVKPKYWRSLLDSGYETLPAFQMITPEIQKKLEQFIGEYRKYYMVHWIANINPGIIILMIKPNISQSGGSDTNFIFYDINGNLLNAGLTFQRSFEADKNSQTDFLATTPEGFCSLQQEFDKTDLLLIRMGLKGNNIKLNP